MTTTTPYNYHRASTAVDWQAGGLTTAVRLSFAKRDFAEELLEADAKVPAEPGCDRGTALWDLYAAWRSQHRDRLNATPEAWRKACEALLGDARPHVRFGRIELPSAYSAEQREWVIYERSRGKETSYLRFKGRSRA